MTKAIKPDDILSNKQDFIEINGKAYRKGSVAAFIKNIDLLEDPKSTKEQKESVLKMIKELAPAIVALGLRKHVTFKNKIVEDILNTVE